MRANVRGRTPVEEAQARLQVVDIRKSIEEALGDKGIDQFIASVSTEDIRLLAHIRAIGYGNLEITVINGFPVSSRRIEEKIDYRAELKFKP